MSIELKRAHNDASKTEDWDDEIHRRFVEAIFEEGMKTCSPSVLIDQMHFKANYITSERVKSHLQKFRRNKAKSVANFLDSYDVAIDTYNRYKKDLSRGNHDEKLSLTELDRIASTFIDSSKIGALTSGEVAAYLSLADRVTPDSPLPPIDARGQKQKSMEPLKKRRRQNNPVHDEARLERLASISPPNFMAKFLDVSGNSSGTNYIELPALSDDEKGSPLGATLCYVMGMFFSLRQRIMDERKKKAAVISSSSLNGDVHTYIHQQPKVAASQPVYKVRESSHFPTSDKSGKSHRHAQQGAMMYRKPNVRHSLQSECGANDPSQSQYQYVSSSHPLLPRPYDGGCLLTDMAAINTYNTQLHQRNDTGVADVSAVNPSHRDDVGDDNVFRQQSRPDARYRKESESEQAFVGVSQYEDSHLNLSRSRSLSVSLHSMTFELMSTYRPEDSSSDSDLDASVFERLPEMKAHLQKGHPPMDSAARDNEKKRKFKIDELKETYQQIDKLKETYQQELEKRARTLYKI